MERLSFLSGSREQNDHLQITFESTRSFIRYSHFGDLLSGGKDRSGANVGICGLALGREEGWWAVKEVVVRARRKELDELEKWCSEGLREEEVVAAKRKIRTEVLEEE